MFAWHLFQYVRWICMQYQQGRTEEVPKKNQMEERKEGVEI